MNTRLTPAEARALRRRHKHERQAVLFGMIIAALAVVALGALAVYSGAVTLPGQPEFRAVEEKGARIEQPQVCVPPDTLPVAAGEVSVTVLNGSDRAGLAGSVGELLADRGFLIENTGNDPRGPVLSLISFGAEGIAQAYTLRAHIPDAQLVLDARTGTSVDLTVATSFTTLAPLETVELDPATALTPVAGCADIATVTPLPAPARLAAEEEPAKGEAATDEDAGDA